MKDIGVEQKRYYTYILRCEDNSLYTGITTDIERRLLEHKSQSDKSAKYTRTHRVISLEAAWCSEDRVLASKLEYHIKRLSKQQKENLIVNNSLTELLGNKINVDKYIKIQ